MSEKVLDVNTASMSSSDGIKLLTAGRYIPHDITVVPTEDYTISSKISNLTISKSTLTSLSINGPVTIEKIDGNNTPFCIKEIGSTIIIGIPELTISSNQIYSTKLSTSKVIIKDLASSVTINSFSDNASVTFNGTTVANSNGLITASPTFSRADTVVSCTITPASVTLSDDSSSGISIDVLSTADIPSTVYSDTATGWIDISKSTTAFASQNFTNSVKKYITNLSINSSSHTLNRIESIGTIKTLSNNGIIETFGGDGTIKYFLANEKINTFSGSITYDNVTMSYDATSGAVIFSY